MVVECNSTKPRSMSWELQGQYKCSTGIPCIAPQITWVKIKIGQAWFSARSRSGILLQAFWCFLYRMCDRCMCSPTCSLFCSLDFDLIFLPWTNRRFPLSMHARLQHRCAHVWCCSSNHSVAVRGLEEKWKLKTINPGSSSTDLNCIFFQGFKSENDCEYWGHIL